MGFAMIFEGRTTRAAAGAQTHVQRLERAHEWPSAVADSPARLRLPAALASLPTLLLQGRRRQAAAGKGSCLLF